MCPEQTTSAAGALSVSGCIKCPDGGASNAERTVCNCREWYTKDENGDCKAPVDSSFFVEFKVTLPYIKSSFGEAEQAKYISAVATAANTSPSNVEIVSITEVRRRAGNIEVHILATVCFCLCLALSHTTLFAPVLSRACSLLTATLLLYPRLRPKFARLTNQARVRLRIRLVLTIL